MKLRKILIVVIFTLLSIEGAFRLDPNGLLRYKISMHRISMSDGSMFRPIPGVYPLTDGAITVTNNEVRYTPDTAHSNCRIAVVGDSVTFGWEVNDRQTWVNLLAKQYQGAQFDNLGVAGYNVEHVSSLVHSLNYDGYIYLYFENDDVVEMSILDYTAPSAAITYLYAMTYKPHIVEMSNDEVLTVLNNLPQNTFVFGFDLPKTVKLAQSYPITVIPFYTSFISSIDWHPDSTGHQQIYEHIKTQVGAFVEATCNKFAKSVVQ